MPLLSTISQDVRHAYACHLVPPDWHLISHQAHSGIKAPEVPTFCPSLKQWWTTFGIVDRACGALWNKLLRHSATSPNNVHANPMPLASISLSSLMGTSSRSNRCYATMSAFPCRCTTDGAFTLLLNTEKSYTIDATGVIFKAPGSTSRLKLPQRKRW